MPLLKNMIFSVILILAVECSADNSIKTNLFDIYERTASLTRELQNKPLTYKNVTYYLYTIYNPDEYIQLNMGNLYLFVNTKIVFFIHGWTNSKDIAWYKNLKNAFLEKYSDYYVVEVDWKDPANQIYYVSSFNTFDVAKIISHLIVDLIFNHGVCLEDVLLIGHSLGGQITGFVGKYFYNMTGEKLPRIIALDPAGPLFNERPYDERLNRDDADVVEVIHTNGGILGYKDAVGTIDFFPNGGTFQPGCLHIYDFNVTTFIDPLSCDHHRAYEYFIEAILHPRKFIATKCSDWDSYEAGECRKNEKVSMGDITVEARGHFYLKTKIKKDNSKNVE